MSKVVRFPLISIILSVFCMCLQSCEQEDTIPESSDPGGRLILIYAVAANNLQKNFYSDMQELKDVAPRLDLKRNKVLVYAVLNDAVCALMELDSQGRLDTVARFPELPLSTSPERINEVMEMVRHDYAAYPYKGLVLWSHATGWLPYFGGNSPRKPVMHSFGSDNYHDANYQTNITDLADAIPAGLFDFIWFDCCYMANIETYYQLRDKCDHLVGSVLETDEDGMPYDLTMPYLLRREADLRAAAFEFYDSCIAKDEFYQQHMPTVHIAVSVSIVDTQALNALASASRVFFATGQPPLTFTDIQNYSRLSGNRPFYDMEQFLDAYSDVNEIARANLKQAFSDAVTFKLISDKDFNGRPISVADYSGLSMHAFADNGTPDNNFYKVLDWYKATR